ncbi:MAG: acyl-CoA synthetase FdrA [Acetobacteraceae bacterium]
MAKLAKVMANFYRDSVTLMQLSARLAALPGISQASVVMASESNLALLREAGLLSGEVAAGSNDLLLAIEGGEAAVAAGMAAAEEGLNEALPATNGGLREQPPLSLEMGLEKAPSANLALISTPGDYAAAEAMKALRLGLNVMLFSDNVRLADEIALKRYAAAHALMMMGPDCGTAIIGGVPLGFANVVRRGNIGLVGASGTGLQQVSTLIDRLGAGISQAIGTGGHDLSAEVGGITARQGLAALAADEATRVIVLISKPPAPEVAPRVLEEARRTGKPVIVNFIGADANPIAALGLTPAKTLEDAAVAAVALATGAPIGPADWPTEEPPGTAEGKKNRRRGYVRGLYSGGTFCYEASLLLGECLADVFSNTPVGPVRKLENVWQSQAHTLVDLGDDVFTRGRPHPMIDLRLRLERLASEAHDPETAVILLDIVLGYGAHPDPAGAIAPAIEAAIAEARMSGRHLAVVGFVCGTAADPQNLELQQARLADGGMILARSNAEAVRRAARIALAEGA